MIGQWFAERRKTIAVVVVGLVQLAAFIVDNPAKLPPWVVAVAVGVNAVAVYWVRNAPPAAAKVEPDGSAARLPVPPEPPA